MNATISNSIPVLSQSDLSIHIDRFVGKALSTAEPAYDIDLSKAKPYRLKELGFDLGYLRQMIDLFNGRADCAYSENLRLFIDACHDIALEDLGSQFVCPCPDRQGYLDQPECLNLLVDRIRQLGQANEYRRQVSDRRYEAARQSDAVGEYAYSVMERYARTLVIRVNLYYRTEARLRLKVEDVFADMDRLAKAYKTHPLFESVTGYILRIEQGVDQGFHIHAGFFFDGSKVCREFSKAEQIGCLWEEITQGRGYWHDSGRSWDGDASQRGTGMFHRSDAVGREAVRKLMTYLTKDTQYLRIKPARAKAYRTGRSYVAACGVV